MVAIRFEWDEHKNRFNRRKHGISFERAINVLRDPWVVSIPDQYTDGEQRWKSIGLVGGFTLLLVVHTVREDDDVEVVRVISARYANTAARRSFMEKKMVSYTWETLPALTDADLEDLKARAPKCDSEIDTSDIPELTQEQWKGAVRGRFYRPAKQELTARIDVDVLGWLKSQGEDYESRVNAILRREMLADSGQREHLSRE